MGDHDEEKDHNNKSTRRQPHCLVLAFPIQGHINPMIQFSKRLVHKGVRVTFVVSHFLLKTLKLQLQASSSSFSSNISFESISDGHDDGGISSKESDTAYVDRFWDIGPKTLKDLLERLTKKDHVDCVVYDSFMPWALEVTKSFKNNNILGATFLTQACAVNSIYYHHSHGNLGFFYSSDHQEEIVNISLPALPSLAPSDLPSFLNRLGHYPGFTKMVVDQFSDIEKADWVLCNSFYELESEVVDWLAKVLPIKTIGPTIPSMFLDKQLQNDKGYGFNLFDTKNDDICMKWLNDKPNGSVVYVSFGSLAVMDTEQMEELAWGLNDSGAFFLWVVRASEQNKLPKDFLAITANKSLVVTWCPQLRVLEHEAIGCFVTHCGWNSTLEAVSLGVPMVGIPQWTDQPMNAKLIMDMWKMGVKAKSDERGIVKRHVVSGSVKEVMENEGGKEMKKNALKWKNLATKVYDKDGSSNTNVDDFVASLLAPI